VLALRAFEWKPGLTVLLIALVSIIVVVEDDLAVAAANAQVFGSIKLMCLLSFA